MPDYDVQQFDPPAPVARVTVRMLDRGISDVPMLIDSGADVTLIPQTCAERLGLVGQLEVGLQLRGITGNGLAAKVVEAQVVFLGRNFRGRFPLIDAEYGIGRNVLNNVALLFDGPRLNWREASR